jgi:hypothetical protein
LRVRLGAYSEEKDLKDAPLVENIGLGFKILTLANTLAYSASSSVTNIVSVLILTRGVELFSSSMISGLK